MRTFITSKYEISYVFLFLWLTFDLLDPDPDLDSESGSGSTDLIESSLRTVSKPFATIWPTCKWTAILLNLLKYAYTDPWYLHKVRLTTIVQYLPKWAISWQPLWSVLLSPLLGVKRCQSYKKRPCLNDNTPQKPRTNDDNECRRFQWRFDRPECPGLKSILHVGRHMVHGLPAHFTSGVAGYCPLNHGGQNLVVSKLGILFLEAGIYIFSLQVQQKRASCIQKA